MDDVGIVEIETDAEGQVLRLPEPFRLPGREVRLRRVGRGVMVEPVESDLAAWWAKLDRYLDEPFMPEGRPEQPPMPPPEDIFDE